MIEVEQKFRIDDVDVVDARLQRIGAQPQPIEQHADTYYNHPSRDFQETREALRVRRIDGRPIVTYKGTKLPGTVKAREELEWPLAPGDPAGDKMQRLLELLGFRCVATVRKSRAPYELDDPAGAISITIDRVDGLGCYVEIETMVAAANEIEAARMRVLSIASQLSLDEVEPRSYLSLHLAAGLKTADARSD